MPSCKPGAMRRLGRLKDWDDREWIPNLPAQVGAVLCFGVFALIGLSGLTVGSTKGDQIVGTAVLILAVVLVGRSLVAPTLDVNPRALVIRKLLRTRRLAWSDIAQITIEEGRTGITGGQREFLVVQLMDSTTWRHKELNAPAGRRHRSPCRVHDAFAAANRELRRQRSILSS